MLRRRGSCTLAIFLAGYVPKLQCEGQVVRFLLDCGYPIPSPAALGKIGQAYVRAIDRFAHVNSIPVVHFAKGACKEDVARPYLRAAERDGRFGVVTIGVAQEKLVGRKGYKRGGSAAHPHFVYRRMSAFPNHYHFYVRDPEWGPAFIKMFAYAPFPLRTGWGAVDLSAGQYGQRWMLCRGGGPDPRGPPRLDRSHSRRS